MADGANDNANGAKPKNGAGAAATPNLDKEEEELKRLMSGEIPPDFLQVTEPSKKNTSDNGEFDLLLTGLTLLLTDINAAGFVPDDPHQPPPNGAGANSASASANLDPSLLDSAASHGFLEPEAQKALGNLIS